MALRGGRNLTRDEIREALERSGIAVGEGLRLTYILMHAELEGLLCSGPRRGKQFTYALLAERAPAARVLGRDEALAELAGRYFHSRGPATVYDFAKWSGLTLTQARQGLEAVKAGLSQERAGGESLWFAAVEPVTSQEPRDSHLLSIYDEYISSYKDRSAIVSDAHAARLVAAGSALYYVIVIAGWIAGMWRRSINKDVVHIDIDAYRSLSQAEWRTVRDAAGRYAAFLDLPQVVIGP
jgi:hypothetical protein